MLSRCPSLKTITTVPALIGRNRRGACVKTANGDQQHNEHSTHNHLAHNPLRATSNLTANYRIQIPGSARLGSPNGTGCVTECSCATVCILLSIFTAAHGRQAMSIPLAGTFEYVAVVPANPQESLSPWPLRLRAPVKHTAIPCATIACLDIPRPCKSPMADLRRARLPALKYGEAGSL